MNRKDKKPRDIGFYVLILIVLIAVIFLMVSNQDVETMKYSEVISLFQEEKVTTFTVDGDMLVMSLKEPYNGRYTATHQLYSFSVFYEDLHELIEEQSEAGIITDYNYAVGWQAPWWLTFVPYLLILVVFGVLWFVMMNRSGGGDKGAMRFGPCRHHRQQEHGALRHPLAFLDLRSARWHTRHHHPWSETRQDGCHCRHDR